MSNAREMIQELRSGKSVDQVMKRMMEDLQMGKVGGVATTVSSKGGFTDVTYHNTNVVSFNDKVINLNTGGWFTNTTKTRMNQAANEYGLEFTVFQKNGEWFVTHKGKTISFDGDKLTLKR